jgi:hypothetical protein
LRSLGNSEFGALGKTKGGLGSEALTTVVFLKLGNFMVVTPE